MAVNSARRRTVGRLAALAVGSAVGALTRAAQAQEAAARPAAGAAYRAIAPQPVPDGNVVELVEFFWYGCPYCAQFEPYLRAWLNRQRSDVLLRRVPATFRPSWVPHGRLYYTLEALSALERLHAQVYLSYHVERTPLDSTDAIAEWAQQHGIERERWLSVYGSEEIDARIARAREDLLRYEVSGTPSVVVDGRYLTSSGMTPGVAAMIPVLEELIARVRGQRGLR